MDIAKIPQVDIVADVTRPLPFRDSSVDHVYASHLVEHMEDLMGFMGEVWRICKPGALVQFRFPHGTTPFGTWRDPTHRRGVYLDTFDYFDPNTLDGYMFGYYNPAKFEMVKQRLYFNMNADTFLPGARAACRGAHSGRAGEPQRAVAVLLRAVLGAVLRVRRSADLDAGAEVGSAVERTSTTRDTEDHRDAGRHSGTSILRAYGIDKGGVVRPQSARWTSNFPKSNA